MWSDFDWWKFIAGLGIFLYGLFQFESGLRDLTGRSFKRFLKRQTQNRLRGILSGTIVTAILQSSSVVSLMVLAFVGAGVMSLKHSLGIIFGSNLGTTFTGWIVTILGFKLNIEALSLPIIGLGALTMVAFGQIHRISLIGRTAVGFGFIFLGLGFMKTSVEFLSGHLDLEDFNQYGSWLFLLIGFGFTAIIQSSSATMAITLSALNSQIISLEAAAALVIGADLGTTITVIIGSFGGSGTKKQVAMGHFLFNLTNDVIAFLLLPFLLTVVTVWLGFKDPLMALVVFHSSFNLIGIAIFYPITEPFAKFLKSRFTDSKYSLKITDENLSRFESPLALLYDEVDLLLKSTINYNLTILNIHIPEFVKSNKKNGNWGAEDDYEEIKNRESGILDFYSRLVKQGVNQSEGRQLQNFIFSARNSQHASKNVKDIKHDIKEFNQSANEDLIKLFDQLIIDTTEFYTQLIKTLGIKNTSPFEDLVALLVLNQDNYDRCLHRVYQQLSTRELSTYEITSLLNVNRQIFTSNEDLITAIKDLKLKDQSSIKTEVAEAI